MKNDLETLHIFNQSHDVIQRFTKTILANRQRHPFAEECFQLEAMEKDLIKIKLLPESNVRNNLINDMTKFLAGDQTKDLLIKELKDEITTLRDELARVQTLSKPSPAERLQAGYLPPRKLSQETETKMVKGDSTKMFKTKRTWF